MVHDFISDLLVIFHVDSAILEHTVLNLDIIKQTIFWVKSIEESVLIVDGFPLSWDVSVVLRPRASLSESNHTLA